MKDKLDAKAMSPCCASFALRAIGIGAKYLHVAACMSRRLQAIKALERNFDDYDCFPLPRCVPFTHLPRPSPVARPVSVRAGATSSGWAWPSLAQAWLCACRPVMRRPVEKDEQLRDVDKMKCARVAVVPGHRRGFPHVGSRHSLAVAV